MLRGINDIVIVLIASCNVTLTGIKVSILRYIDQVFQNALLYFGPMLLST